MLIICKDYGILKNYKKFFLVLFWFFYVVGGKSFFTILL